MQFLNRLVPSGFSPGPSLLSAGFFVCRALPILSIFFLRRRPSIFPPPLGCWSVTRIGKVPLELSSSNSRFSWSFFLYSSHPFFSTLLFSSIYFSFSSFSLNGEEVPRLMSPFLFVVPGRVFLFLLFSFLVYRTIYVSFI